MAAVKKLNTIFSAAFAVFFAFHTAIALTHHLSLKYAAILACLTVLCFVLVIVLISSRSYYRRAFAVLQAAIMIIFSAVILLYAAASIAMSTRSRTSGNIPNDAVVIILGAGLSPDDQTSPSLILQRRLRTAKGYLDTHKDAIIIVSGGQGAGEKISEALSMYNWLTAHGIDPTRIIMEDKSSSTAENIEFSIKSAQEYNITLKDAAIVTDDFHEYRASIIAERHGLKPYSLSSHATFGLRVYYWTREVAGVVLQIWLGL